MIKETVLRDFPNWTSEKQLSEYQAYKKLGDYSPFSDADYELMEMVMNNPNAEIAVECEDGICSIVESELITDDLNELLNEAKEEFKDIVISLLRHPKVINYYKSKSNKDHMLSLYKRSLKDINDDDFLAKLKSYFDILPSGAVGAIDKASLMRWEKNIYQSDKATMNLLASKNFIEFGPTDDDKLILKYDSIEPKDLAGRKGLSALLVLDLLNGLGVTDRKTFISKIKGALKTEDAPITTAETQPNLEKSEKDKTNDKISELLTNMSHMVDLITPETAIKGKSETIDMTGKSYRDYLAANGIGFEDTDVTGVSFDDRMESRMVVKYKLADKSPNISMVAAKRMEILTRVSAKGVLDVDWGNIPGFPDESLLKTPAPAQMIELLNASFTAMKNAGSPYSEAADKLITFGDAGEGRGEKFVEFVFPYANSGGTESYDIKIGPQKYEIKTYNADSNSKTITESIRLGQEGNIFKIDRFTALFMFISDLSKVFIDAPENNNFQVVQEMLNNAITEERYIEISKLLHETTKSGNTLIDQIKKGEFSYTNIEKTSRILDILNIGFKSIKENNFYYLKIYLNDENYNLSIQPKTPKTVRGLTSVDDGAVIAFTVKSKIIKAVEQDVKNSILRILSNSEIFSTPNYLQTMIEDGITKINDEFKQHPMIIISDHLRGGNTSIAAVGIFNRFQFRDITQNGFKVIPEGYTLNK